MHREESDAATEATEVSEEFKAEVPRQVRQGGNSVRQVVRDPDSTESAIRRWVEQAKIEVGDAPRAC